MYLMDFDGKFGMELGDGFLQELEENILIIMYTITMVDCNTHNLFNLNELEESGHTTINYK